MSVMTTELCGVPYDPKDPASPRCAVIKEQHRGRPHQALAGKGKVLEWPVKA